MYLKYQRTKFKQRDKKIYVVRKEEIPLYPRVATNH